MVQYLEKELNIGVSILQPNISAYSDLKEEISRTPFQFTLNLRNILRNFPEFLEKTKIPGNLQVGLEIELKRSGFDIIAGGYCDFDVKFKWS